MTRARPVIVPAGNCQRWPRLAVHRPMAAASFSTPGSPAGHLGYGNTRQAPVFLTGKGSETAMSLALDARANAEQYPLLTGRHCDDLQAGTHPNENEPSLSSRMRQPPSHLIKEREGYHAIF
jgi:hypothetical protein